jgi:hypothetical protein
MNPTFKTHTKIELRSRNLKVIPKIRPDTKIVCERGVLWVTQNGDQIDHILLPGDQFTPRKSRRMFAQPVVLVEAVRDSVVRID